MFLDVGMTSSSSILSLFFQFTLKSKNPQSHQQIIPLVTAMRRAGAFSYTACSHHK